MLTYEHMKLISEQLLGKKETHIRKFMLTYESSKRGVAEKKHFTSSGLVILDVTCQHVKEWRAIYIGWPNLLG